MFHFSGSFKLLQWPAIPFVALGLMMAGTFPLGTQGAQAAEADYGACAAALVGAGIAPDAAAAACALANEPTTVSRCVTDVLAVTTLDPNAVLSACSRDRRPDEVATCVGNIHEDLVVDDSLAVLVHCHRSILPERYADCVVGIATEIGYTTEESMTRCIAAGYRPENVAPTFIPLE